MSHRSLDNMKSIFTIITAVVLLAAQASMALPGGDDPAPCLKICLPSKDECKCAKGWSPYKVGYGWTCYKDQDYGYGGYN